MSLNEELAQQLLVEAKKNLSSSSGFFSFLFGKSTRIDEAIHCYEKAGNLFKLNKNWLQAGDAFQEAANLHIQTDNKHEAAVRFIDAASSYKKIHFQNAISCYLKAIEIYVDMGRFGMVAKYHETIAQLYENDAVDVTRAIEHYNQASNYFQCEDSVVSARKCQIKIAHYAALSEDYQRAIKIYEDVSSLCLESSLLKYTAKEYLFRAALCHLCLDLLNVQHILDYYIEIYPAFEDSREYKLLHTLIQCVEEANSEAFTEAVKQYDSVARLDSWHTTILLRIKTDMDNNINLR